MVGQVDKKTRKIEHIVQTGNRRFYARILTIATLMMAGQNPNALALIKQLKTLRVVVYGKMSDTDAIQANLKENALKAVGDKSLDAAGILTAVFTYGHALREAGITMKESTLNNLGLKRGSQIKYFGLFRLACALPELNLLPEVVTGKIKLPSIPQGWPRGRAVEVEKLLAEHEYLGDEIQLQEASKDYTAELVNKTLKYMKDPSGKQNVKKMAAKKVIEDAANDRELPVNIRETCKAISINNIFYSVNQVPFQTINVPS